MRKLKAYNGMITRDKTVYLIAGMGADGVNMKNRATGEVTFHTFAWICQCLLTRTLKLAMVEEKEVGKTLDPETCYTCKKDITAEIEAGKATMLSENTRDYNCEECVSRADLEYKHGQVWNTKELQEDYTVESFLAPYCTVTRKADGVRGCLEFQHMPRFYWAFGEFGAS